MLISLLFIFRKQKNLYFFMCSLFSRLPQTMLTVYACFCFHTQDTFPRLVNSLQTSVLSCAKETVMHKRGRNVLPVLMAAVQEQEAMAVSDPSVQWDISAHVPKTKPRLSLATFCSLSFIIFNFISWIPFRATKSPREAYLNVKKLQDLSIFLAMYSYTSVINFHLNHLENWTLQ